MSTHINSNSNSNSNNSNNSSNQTGFENLELFDLSKLEEQLDKHFFKTYQFPAMDHKELDKLYLELEAYNYFIHPELEVNKVCIARIFRRDSMFVKIIDAFDFPSPQNDLLIAAVTKKLKTQLQQRRQEQGAEYYQNRKYGRR